MYRLSGTAFVCLSLGVATAQTTAGVAEMSSKDEPATFRSRVNLVMVPVVVRDKQGRAIGNLRQEDFQLFDRGKPQVISRFSVERPGIPAASPRMPMAAKARSRTMPGWTFRSGLLLTFSMIST